MITRALVSAIFAAALLADPALAQQAAPQAEESAAISAAPAGTGHAQVNGISLYYEVHGQGEPLILLHGGLGNTAMFGPVLPALAQGRQVVAVDMRGHGRTADIERPMRYEIFADDIAALITHLGFEKADIMGNSLGGGVALRTAIQHPEVVNRLVVVSAPFSNRGWYPEVSAAMSSVGAAMAGQMVGTPMHTAYLAAAPRPDDFRLLSTRSARWSPSPMTGRGRSRG